MVKHVIRKLTITSSWYSYTLQRISWFIENDILLGSKDFLKNMALGSNHNAEVSFWSCIEIIIMEQKPHCGYSSFRNEHILNNVI